MQFTEWSRLDPKFSKKLKFSKLNLLFDGDHALGNEFYVREHTSIENVLKLTEERNIYLKAEKEQEETLEKFKKHAAIGDISINLKDLNDEWFYESEHYNEFWRVAYEIYKKQN